MANLETEFQMKNYLFIALSGIAFSSGTALADTSPPFVLGYEQFEAAIAHVDLEECPEGISQFDVFCRGTLANDEFHVFVFSDADDSPLIQVVTYSTDALVGLLR